MGVNEKQDVSKVSGVDKVGDATLNTELALKESQSHSEHAISETYIPHIPIQRKSFASDQSFTQRKKNIDKVLDSPTTSKEDLACWLGEDKHEDEETEKGSYSYEAIVLMYKCRWQKCTNAYDSEECLKNHIILDHIDHSNKSELNCPFNGCHKKRVETSKFREHLKDHSFPSIKIIPFTCSVEGCHRLFVDVFQVELHQCIDHQREKDNVKTSLQTNDDTDINIDVTEATSPAPPQSTSCNPPKRAKNVAEVDSETCLKLCKDSIHEEKNFFDEDEDEVEIAEDAEHEKGAVDGDEANFYDEMQNSTTTSTKQRSYLVDDNKIVMRERRLETMFNEEGLCTVCKQPGKKLVTCATCLRHQHRECVHNAPKKNNIWRCKPCIDMRRKLKEGHQNEATTPFSLAHWLPRSFSIAVREGFMLVCCIILQTLFLLSPHLSHANKTYMG
eukprot:m.51189 g.51189  ORF g.51189 m.51189 type:complete len:445 (-) comp7550_c0_seq1:966-2300(-)